MSPVDALREVDFNWAVGLSEVWDEAPYDVPAMHKEIRKEFASRLRRMARESKPQSPLGWVVLGVGGTGKSHLLGAFRRETFGQDATFIQIDMTDVRDFWDIVLQGYIASLQQSVEGEFQWRRLLRRVIENLGPNKPAGQILKTLAERKSENLPNDIRKVIEALTQYNRVELQRHHNVVRALLCFNSGDYAVFHVGYTWLLGQAIEEPDRLRYGFTLASEQPRRIVEGLSWLLSLGGPTVLALDQLDPIVTHAHFKRLAESITDEQAAAQSIIVQIGGGLGALRDTTKNTLVVVTCIESTWQYLRESAMKTAVDRFDSPRELTPAGTADLARALVIGRLTRGYSLAGFKPPYPTWPFRSEAFEDLKIGNPREILKICDKHRRECLQKDDVTELVSFKSSSFRLNQVEALKTVSLLDSSKLDPLDGRLAEFSAEADVLELLEEKKEDERLAPLIRSALICLLMERPLPERITGRVDIGFTGGSTTRPLHARLRLVFETEDEREEHFCVRALQNVNAIAFQNRLKIAMTQSGIDRALPFRHLAIFRKAQNPTGTVTTKLVQEFRKAGGRFVAPTDQELRTLAAVHRLRVIDDPGFERWLRSRRPLARLGLMRALVPYPYFFEGLDDTSPNPVEVKPVDTKAGNGQGAGPKPVIQPVVPEPKNLEDPPIDDPKPPSGYPAPRTAPLPVGRQWVGNKAGDDLTMPIGLLNKHTFVVAGAGSGKTVLVRRLIEEAAILGVPTLVIDAARDLTTLDERWKEAPENWRPEDHERADRYHERLDYVLWTPGREQGNPIAFEPLPDFSAVADDGAELKEAIEMAFAALAPYVAKGGAAAAEKKRGILSRTLRFFAKQGAGRLEDLIAILDDLPAGAGLGVAKEADLASQMADALKVAVETNPMLQSAGAKLDPALLFGPTRAAKTRVSVVSLIGLTSDEAQQAFVNQLAMTLFGWIKRNPDPAPRPLRGLLVIDEAKDLVPAVKATACKESLQKLAAQARKYHLGLIFATQNPKDVDNKIVGNCSTHFYGKANSPNAIDLIKQLIQTRGGSGNDVPTLPRGRFFFHNADSGHPIPVKIEVPLCLSRHPTETPDDAAILRKAADCRGRLGLGVREPLKSENEP